MEFIEKSKLKAAEEDFSTANEREMMDPWSA